MDLQILKDSKKVVGTKQTTRALKEDAVEQIFIANDAEEHIVQSIISLSQEKGVEVVFVDTMKDLGKACNIQVKAACVALLK